MSFAVFTWTTLTAKPKQNKTWQWKLSENFLVLGSNKKKAYISTVCTKSASKDSLNCFAIFGSSACQGQHVFSIPFLTCTAPLSSDTNV